MWGCIYLGILLLLLILFKIIKCCSEIYIKLLSIIFFICILLYIGFDLCVSYGTPIYGNIFNKCKNNCNYRIHSGIIFGIIVLK